MRRTFDSSHATYSRRAIIALATGGALSAAAIGPMRALASQTTGYEPGQPVNSTSVTFAGGTYTTVANNTLYQYANDSTGSAYYNTYDGTAWSGWTAYEQQPAKSSYDPCPVTYNDASYAYYTGDDGYLYQQSWDAAKAPVWEDVSGDYTYAAAPYASVYEDTVHLYGVANDGYVYHKPYSEAVGWGTWEPVNDPAAPAKTDAKPVAVSWADHDNVFWTGEDGYVYWNRYNYANQTWTGAKQIPSDYTFAGTPYAVGYAPETSLYAYGVNVDGVPVYNKFDGSAWAGWQQYQVTWTSTYQPNAYVYEDTQHVIYTAADAHAYYTTYSGGTWGEWQDLGPNYGYGAYQYSYADGLYLTYTGEDGQIYTRTYAGGGAALDPTPTPEPAYTEPTPTPTY
jgi:hypothetical protein